MSQIGWDLKYLILPEPRSPLSSREFPRGLLPTEFPTRRDLLKAALFTTIPGLIVAIYLFAQLH